MNTTMCPKCGLKQFTANSVCKSCAATLSTVNDAVSSTAIVRKAGLKKIVTGIFLLLVGGGVNYFLLAVFNILPAKLIGFTLCLPPLWSLLGLFQFVTGLTPDELSQKWDNLAGWQRGIIGAFGFVGGLAMVMVGLFAVLYVLDMNVEYKR